MRVVTLGLAWLCLCVGTVLMGFAATHSWFTLSDTYRQPLVLIQPSNQVAVAATANPAGQVKGVQSVMETEDGRAVVVARFLERHNSPLTPHNHFGKVFVDVADKYGIDFRLLPAIAMQESNLCKRIPEGSYNCLGFGVHSRGTLAFESFEANFDRAARELKANYIDQGRTTPEEIMRKYTPSSNGSWANSINQWMAEMRYDDRQKGREADYNGNVLEFAVTPSPTAKP